MDYVLESGFDDLDCLSDIYVIESLHYKVLRDNFKVKHMEAMNESYDIIVEGMSDVLSGMAEVFRKMIEAIKNFFSKLFMYISSYFMDINKFVKTYKDKLNKLSNIDFTINGYEFNLETQPNLSEFENIVNSYNDGIANIKSIKKEDILIQQRKYLEPEHLNALRAQVLGSTEVKIDEDTFAEVVRKFYRDGQEDTITIQVDDARFKKAIDDVETLSKGKKEAEKLRDLTISLFNKAENFFNKNATLMYKDKNKVIYSDVINLDMDKKQFKTGTTDERVYNSEGKSNVVNLFLRFKYNQTHQLALMSNIVVREYANAYKDAVKMTREIIRKSISNNKTDKEESKAE